MTEVQKTRYSIDIDLVHREHLAAIAKQFKLNQGEVIEVLIDVAGWTDAVNLACAARREEKVAGRQPKNALYTKFRNMTPEQIALIERLAAEKS